MTMHRLLLPALLLFSACGIHSAVQASHSFRRLGDYENAYRVLAEEARDQRRDGGTVDVSVEQALASARQAVLLDRARRDLFAERENDALAKLAELESLAPAYPELEELRAWAILKLAEREAERGMEFLTSNNFTEAMKCFVESERLHPGLASVEKGKATVQARIASLSGRAQQQFLEALRKLPEFRYVEVQWHAANVIKNTPDNDEAKELRQKATHENAMRALERGRTCAKDEQFGAALLEFRKALKLQPDLKEAEGEIAQMEKELQVLHLADQAQREMRSGHFDRAREMLTEALGMSVLTRGHVSDLMVQVSAAEGEARYREARDTELLGDKRAALAAYEAMQEKWPKGVQDEAARITALKVDIEGATTEWAAAEVAEAAGELSTALEHYQATKSFYPTWPDVEARIERVQKAIAKKAAGSGGAGG